MKEFVLFGKKVTDFVELTELICSNILDSNYFLTGETLDIDLISIVKPHLNDEEMKEFEEFLDML